MMMSMPVLLLVLLFVLLFVLLLVLTLVYLLPPPLRPHNSTLNISAPPVAYMMISENFGIK